MDIKYGTFGPVTVESLPAASLEALIRRGLSHFMGNEQAAKVSAAKAKATADGGTALTEDEIASKLQANRESAWAALLAGEIGLRAPAGESVDPFEKLQARIAREQVEAILRANGLKVPKKDGTVTFADGKVKTMSDMIAARLEKNGPAIEKEATKRQKDAEAKRKAAEASAVGSSATTEDLGL